MKRLIIIGVLTIAYSLSSYAQNFELRTVFVYSFTKYVHWPEDYGSGNFTIHVLGDSPILEELQKLAKIKKIGTRSISVSKVEQVADLDKCHILIVPTTMSSDLEGVLQKAKNTSTLIVTDEPGLGSKGSHINFVEKNGRLLFEINQGAIDQKNLKVSKELTRLAIII